MIVYAYLFKCLQPILIIISTLTIGDPCIISNKNYLLELKEKLGINVNSDHLIFYQLYLVRNPFDKFFLFIQYLYTILEMGRIIK